MRTVKTNAGRSEGRTFYRQTNLFDKGKEFGK